MHTHESYEEHEKSSGWSSARQRISRFLGLRRKSKRSNTPKEVIPVTTRFYDTSSSSSSSSKSDAITRRMDLKPSSSMSVSSDDEADDRTIAARKDALSWRTWFLSRPGHQRLLLRIPDEFLADEFNFADLISENAQIRVIISRMLSPVGSNDGLSGSSDETSDDINDEDQHTPTSIENNINDGDIAQLYLLLHARYILTREGLLRIAKRYSRGCFGVCPRFYCARERLLPVGLSDWTGEARVQRYCPSCNDIYHWSSEQYWNIDGAAYGTSFPHFFFLSFPSFVKQEHGGKVVCTLPPLSIYEPKIFGFRLLSISCQREMVGHDGDERRPIVSPIEISEKLPFNVPTDTGVGIGQALRLIPNYHRCR